LFSDIIGVMGGFLVAFFKLGFNPYIYIQNTYDFVNFMDVISGIVKAAVFGFIIAFMGCYFGYHTNKGAEGVGKATTNSVVLSSILIFIFDYIITLFFFKV
jgi:phospholipid/cholesterol/gamma-HCH transport system permease protein